MIAVAALAAGSFAAAADIPLYKVSLPPAEVGTIYDSSKLTEPDFGPIIAVPAPQRNSKPANAPVSPLSGNGLGSITSDRGLAGGNLFSGGRSADVGLKTVDAAERSLKQLITALEAE
ncbi:hypothetical protein ABI59_04165 [Acidobacteria bacterium Mor1]|nr:hypothetical protein ABI59_04165 [Acidobacteria bacterium Mor1]